MGAVREEAFRVNTAIAKTLDICQRLVSLFVATALPAITGGALIGVSVVKSALMAGFLATAQVVQRLAAASVDGTLTAAEIRDAFSSATPQQRPTETNTSKAPKPRAAKAK